MNRLTMTVISPQDLHLVALGVVIWVVALSVAFSFYIPVLRAERARAGPAHRTRDARNPDSGQADGEDAPASTGTQVGGPA